MKKLRTFLGPEGAGGQAIVMVAIMFMALMFAVGLAIDAGQLFAAKRGQQEAADAGAFAGAVVIYQGGTAAQAIAAALADVTQNGFTDGVGSTTVTINAPPTSGQYANESPVKHVEVVIVRQVRTTLVPAEARRPCPASETEIRLCRSVSRRTGWSFGSDAGAFSHFPSRRRAAARPPIRS